MPMRGRLLLLLSVLLVGASCRCGAQVTGTTTEPLAVWPQVLDFGEVYVGAGPALQLTATNRGRAERRVTLTADAPFAVTPASLAVGGGGEGTLEVRFTPATAGTFAAVLRVDEAEVALRGVGLEPLSCAGAACHPSSFDPVAGRCVDTVQPDGTDCTATRACFAQAVCAGGACVGTLTSCDDGNPCTLDVCGESGCGHVDDLLSCPPPANPCRVAACDPQHGCGATDAPDGTACGVRDCLTARVCIAGACVTRAVPQTQGCVEIVAGQPGGLGVADGVGVTARFGAQLRIAADDTGAVWVFDGWYRVLRKVSPAGVVTTVAGVVDPYTGGSWTDGFGTAASFLNPRDVAVEPSGVVTVLEAGAVRLVSPAGQVVTWTGTRMLTSFPRMQDGIGPAAQVGVGVSVASGRAGDVWLVDTDDAQLVLRHVSSAGELRTVASLPPAQDITGLDLAMVSGRLWYTDEAQGVSLVLADGGLVAVADAGVRRLSGSRAGDVALASTHALQVLRADGGVLQRAFPAPDSILDVAALPSGGWALALGFGRPVPPGSWAAPESMRIEILEDDGGLRLLAGPAAPLPVRDGPVATTGLDDPQGVAVDGAGRVFVYELDRVRAVAAGQVTTVCAMPEGNSFRDLARLSSGALAAVRADGVALLDGSDGGLLVLSGGASGIDALGDLLGVAGFGTWLTDGGFAPGPITHGATDLALDAAGGFFEVYGAQVWHVDASGTRTSVAGAPVAGDVDGRGAAARLGLLWAIAREGSGDLFVADQTNRSVRRVTPAGMVTTVARLADTPRRIAVEDGGALLVTVPNAVLRVRP